MPPRPKVLCVGIDSAEKDLIFRWAQAGRLPTLRSLLQRGASAVIKNPDGPLSGSVWSSLNTGVSPGRHGRYWNLQLRPGTYQVVQHNYSDVKAAPFWDALSHAGRRVAIIDQPETTAAPDVNGVHIINWGTHAPDAAGFRTWPPTLAADVTARFGHDPVGSCDDRARLDLPALRRDILTRVTQRTRLSRYFLDRENWDFFTTVFAEAHCMGHHFWHLHDTAHPAYDPKLVEALGNPIEEVYRAVDGALGDLLADMSADTTIVILCSHGMGPCYGGNFLLDNVLRRLEQRRVSRWRARDPFLWGWQRTPEVLRDAVRPLRNRIVQRIDEAALSFDGTRRFFQLPSNDGCGAVRFNLAGREPHGIVQPGAEYDALCETLNRHLLSLVNVDTGTPAVRHVWRTREIFPGPFQEQFPDLFVEWHRNAPIRRVTSPSTGEVTGVDTQRRTGDHTRDGLLLVIGAGVACGDIGAISGIDVAPTIAAMLGVNLPDIEGKVIAALQPHPA